MDAGGAGLYISFLDFDLFGLNPSVLAGRHGSSVTERGGGGVQSGWGQCLAQGLYGAAVSGGCENEQGTFWSRPPAGTWSSPGEGRLSAPGVGSADPTRSLLLHMVWGRRSGTRFTVRTHLLQMTFVMFPWRRLVSTTDSRASSNTELRRGNTCVQSLRLCLVD